MTLQFFVLRPIICRVSLTFLCQQYRSFVILSLDWENFLSSIITSLHSGIELKVKTTRNYQEMVYCSALHKYFASKLSNVGLSKKTVCMGQATIRSHVSVEMSITKKTDATTSKWTENWALFHCSWVINHSVEIWCYFWLRIVGVIFPKANSVVKAILRCLFAKRPHRHNAFIKMWP